MCNFVKIELNISSLCDNMMKYFDQCLVMSCEMLLVVLMFFFYKNVFCEKCNGYCSLNEEFVKVLKFRDWVKWVEMFDLKLVFGKIIVFIYRIFFLLSFYIQEDELNILVKIC